MTPASKNRFTVSVTRPDLVSLHRVRSLHNHRRFFRAFAGVFICLVLALLFLPWQQTATGYGRVVAYSPNERRQEINAPVDGLIARWHVAEGSKVSEGQPIVDLSDNDPEILQRLRSERDALFRRVKAAEVAVQTSKLNLDRQKLLFEKGLSARRAFEQAELEYTRYLVDEANSSAELARMDIRLARQMTQSVRAPVGGTILSILSGQGGQIVKQGQVLAILVPDTLSRAVEVWMKGNDIPLIQAGDRVRLQFEGWPSIQFSGWPSVAVGTFGGKVSLVDVVDNGEGKFRILVSPVKDEEWPSGTYLRQGVRAQGWVLLRQVSLGFELWRQFNGFPPAITREDEKVKKK
jgi:multidrug resistance efflux pump